MFILRSTEVAFLHDGKFVGASVGLTDGKSVGASVGATDGEIVGVAVGRTDGELVGASVGRTDGKFVGASEGRTDGKFVGGDVRFSKIPGGNFCDSEKGCIVGSSNCVDVGVEVSSSFGVESILPPMLTPTDVSTEVFSEIAELVFVGRLVGSREGETMGLFVGSTVRSKFALGIRPGD
jgi:hypothetical protein